MELSFINQRVLWIFLVFSVVFSGACRRRGGREWTRRELLRPVGLTYKFIRIPAGRATLGSRETEGDLPPRKVIVDSFWITDCEITIEQYAEFLSATTNVSCPLPPQVTRAEEGYVPDEGEARDPVTFVSYDDAVFFCQWLSEKAGRCVRLPEEDEWEYAARGGVRRGRYPWGWGKPYGRARYASAGPRLVGSYEPNGYGLCDMAGNVFEWCAAPVTTSAVVKVCARGGSWAEKDPKMLRVYARSMFPRTYRDADVGFRVVMEDAE